MEENKEIKSKRKTITVIKIVVVFIIIGILIGLLVKVYFEKKDKMIINSCNELMENQDYEEFKKKIKKIGNISDEIKAYYTLVEKLDKINEKIKNTDIKDLDTEKYNKIKSMYHVIQKDETLTNEIKEKINEKNIYFRYYYRVSTAKGWEEQKIYEAALEDYLTAQSIIKDVDNEEINKEINKYITNIKEKAYSSFKNKIEKYLNEKNYVDGYRDISSYEEIIKSSEDSELIKLYEKIKKEKEEKEEKEAAEREATRKKIKKQQGVRIGMSKQDVLDSSWGKPTKINKSVYSWGTTEQWVYPNYNHLYFENGKLTSIQTNE